MIFKIKKDYVEAIEIFNSLDNFINHILTLDKNLRNENEFGYNEYNRLYYKIINNNDIISYSLLIHWLKKNYLFKTKKYSSLEYFIERGWSESNAKLELIKRNSELKKRNRLCVEYWLLKGFSENEVNKKIFEIQSNASQKVKKRNVLSKIQMLKNGLTNNEINDFMQNKSHLSKKYWINKGFSEKLAISKISEKQKENSYKLSELKKNNGKNYSGTTTSQYGYWLKKGFNKEEAKLKQSERQSTFSLKKCIEKYGEDEGKKKFTERQTKWANSLNTGGNIKIGYSKVSQDLFYKLLETYDITDKDKIFFATHNKEFRLNKKEGGVWLYDYTDTINKKIIEFNGDMFHGNPKKYINTDTPNPFNKNITAQDMWNKDKLKIDVAIKNGYDVLVIWDSEYRWGNKGEIINKCIKFLKNE